MRYLENENPTPSPMCQIPQHFFKEAPLTVSFCKSEVTCLWSFDPPPPLSASWHSLPSFSPTLLPRQRANQQTVSLLTGKAQYEAIAVRSANHTVQNMVNILPTNISLEVCMSVLFLCISIQHPPHALTALCPPPLSLQAYIECWPTCLQGTHFSPTHFSVQKSIHCLEASGSWLLRVMSESSWWCDARSNPVVHTPQCPCVYILTLRGYCSFKECMSPATFHAGVLNYTLRNMKLACCATC